MHWIDVEIEEMPKDRQVLFFGADRSGLCEWCETDQMFFYVYEPASSYGVFPMGAKMLKSVTHWMELPEPPYFEDIE